MPYELTIKFGEKRYPCRLSFNAICKAEEVMGERLLFSQEIDLFTSARALRAMLWAGITLAPNASQEARDLSLDDVGDLIESENAESVLEQMMYAMREHFGVPDSVGEEMRGDGDGDGSPAEPDPFPVPSSS